MNNSLEDSEINKNISKCPDCNKQVQISFIRNHITECQKYIPTYINNLNRSLNQYSTYYLQFLNAEMDIIKQLITKTIRERKGDKHQQIINFIQKSIKKEIISQQPKSSIQSYIDKKSKNYKPTLNPLVSKNSSKEVKQQKSPKLQKIFIQPKKQFKKQQNSPIAKLQNQGTLLLQDQLVFLNDKPARYDQKIICVYPKCKDPASSNKIENFTYLDECLHTICIYCFKEYTRNNYVKLQGNLKCPNSECNIPIPYIQIKSIIDPTLNASSLDLIQCQKCHENYQFEKGKMADAPKKTTQGKNMTSFMAKHYAQNRFQCPRCRTEQCKQCKSIPYHLGFTCSQFQQHKKKKKCRYCHSVLPKGYMSETGIKTLDDICESEECSNLARQACSKMLGCGHPCYGYIREKSCLPCLNQKCALIKTDELLGQSQGSYCSLCYVEVLSQSPCVRSKCGHIFHYKCLKKRLELKWDTARIIFRFCQCPLCNKWLQLPQEFPLNKILKGFKQLYQKIKQKALKRLVYESANKDPVLKDPSSPYFNNQQKYATTIYAYFECFQCHEPYFGGRKSCAQAMGDLKEGQKFNPKELICPSCCPVQLTDCKKHGKQYISFKCRFCCSVAQWFCWGSTHFCDSCHKRQIAGQYISRIPKQQLPKCGGKQKCPVGGDHGQNGDEFCLGCGICRGQRMDFKDF